MLYVQNQVNKVAFLAFLFNQKLKCYMTQNFVISIHFLRQLSDLLDMFACDALRWVGCSTAHNLISINLCVGT